MHVILEPHIGIVPGASDDIPVNLPDPAADRAYVRQTPFVYLQLMLTCVTAHAFIQPLLCA